MSTHRNSSEFVKVNFVFALTPGPSPDVRSFLAREVGVHRQMPNKTAIDSHDS
jgi:hypothetical protein